MKALVGSLLLIILFHGILPGQGNSGLFEKARFEKARINGEDASKFFRQKIHYPYTPGIFGNIDGNVFVTFTIDKKGQIDSVKVLNQPREMFQSAVLNALNESSGLWVPTTFDGVALYKRYIAAFNFTASNAFQYKKDKSLRYFKRGLLSKALKLINEAISIDPYDIELYQTRALIYKKQVKHDLEVLDEAKCYDLNRDILIDMWFLNI
jgi:tetratricopeptide (TPR) repeat protein